MFKPNFLKNLAAQLGDALPSQVNTLRKDFSKSCESILNQTFSKLDLVTREEFDTQKKVLLRTRQKLETLQKQFDQLEKKSNG